ncbi:YciI family protein [Frateuria aurantia]
MPLYLVRMEHPDGDRWNQHVLEHVLYLKSLIEQGHLLASGPLKETPRRAGFLILRAEHRQDAAALIQADPFAREDLISTLSIEQWDPLFGRLAGESSGQLPPELASLAVQPDDG